MSQAESEVGSVATMGAVLTFDDPEAYIPRDRRRALATGTAMPDRVHGAGLVVDTVTFAITKATATVTPTSGQSKTYGTADPALTYTSSGLVTGDTLTGALARAAGSDVGAYAINLGTLSAGPNYTTVLSAPPVTFAITKATVTVTPNSDQFKVYGTAADPVLTYTASGLTNSDTTAIFTGALARAAGTNVGPYPINLGTLSAGPNYTTVLSPITVNFSIRKSASLGYIGNLFWSAGTGTTAAVTLTGKVTTASTPTVAVTNATVQFLIFASNNLSMTIPDITCAVAVQSTGAATCGVTLGLDNWTVIMRIPSSNAFFTSAESFPVVLTVFKPVTSRYAVGGGWIVDPSFQNKPVAVNSTNNHGYFGLAVAYKADGITPQGQVTYVFRGADGYDYLIKSTSWTGGGLAFGPTTSSFSGKASVIVINPANGELVSGLGGTTYAYRVDVVDGSTDKFAISVYTSTGALYHQAGTTASPIAVGFGAVVVR